MVLYQGERYQLQSGYFPYSCSFLGALLTITREEVELLIVTSKIFARGSKMSVESSFAPTVVKLSSCTPTGGLEIRLNFHRACLFLAVFRTWFQDGGLSRRLRIGCFPVRQLVDWKFVRISSEDYLLLYGN